MNKGGFSWKRFVGISALKSKIARKTGIPTTRSGRQRKIGGALLKGNLLTVLTLGLIQSALQKPRNSSSSASGTNSGSTSGTASGSASGTTSGSGTAPTSMPSTGTPSGPTSSGSGSTGPEKRSLLDSILHEFASCGCGCFCMLLMAFLLFLISCVMNAFQNTP